MENKRLDTARVFERIFAIYRLQAGVLLPAAVILYLVPAALSHANDVGLRALALAGTIIAGVFLQGIVAQAVRDIQDGVRDLSLGGLFRSVSKVLGPLLWTAILVGLGVLVGFFAFIIPGFVLLTWWCVAAPVVVCEVRSPTEAIGRSRELVRGHGWRVFSVLVVTVLLILIAQLVFVTIAAAISDGDVSLTIGSLVAGVITAPVFALAAAVLYLELLQLKGEQLPPSDAAAFSEQH
jgi:hypothetical protein